MSVAKFEGVVESGRIRLPDGVVLPERQVVFVVVPGATPPETRNLPGVRLTNPSDAEKFEMKVSWGETP